MTKWQRKAQKAKHKDLHDAEIDYGSPHQHIMRSKDFLTNDVAQAIDFYQSADPDLKNALVRNSRIYDSFGVFRGMASQESPESDAPSRSACASDFLSKQDFEQMDRAALLQNSGCADPSPDIMVESDLAQSSMQQQSNAVAEF